MILFPSRMGQAQEFGALVRHIAENQYLNATTDLARCRRPHDGALMLKEPVNLLK